ncbi:MAG: hypothetical protein OSA38_07145 [Candidatus Poseidoniaceae archaeon]|nr:hypothetical protein [Candidatus Poseidoniaceae archaeon]
MWTFDEFKTDSDKQIMVVSIVFFLLAFPAYFSFVASGADGAAGMGGVRDYEVSGELTFVELASGGEYIADGTTFDIEDLHTDAIDGADGMNIVGVRITMSYGEDDEQTSATIPGGCVGPQSGQSQADTISGTTEHAGFNDTADGQNGGQGGDHAAEAIWYNDSMTGVISGLSEAEIVEQIDAMGAGLGPYTASISVTAEAGNAPGPGCSRSDEGEDVSYVVELIVFDYTIAPFIEITDV